MKIMGTIAAFCIFAIYSSISVHWFGIETISGYKVPAIVALSSLLVLFADLFAIASYAIWVRA